MKIYENTDLFVAFFREQALTCTEKALGFGFGRERPDEHALNLLGKYSAAPLPQFALYKAHNPRHRELEDFTLCAGIGEERILTDCLQCLNLSSPCTVLKDPELGKKVALQSATLQGRTCAFLPPLLKTLLGTVAAVYPRHFSLVASQEETITFKKDWTDVTYKCSRSVAPRFWKEKFEWTNLSWGIVGEEGILSEIARSLEWNNFQNHSDNLTFRVSGIAEGMILPPQAIAAQIQDFLSCAFQGMKEEQKLELLRGTYLFLEKALGKDAEAFRELERKLLDAKDT